MIDGGRAELKKWYSRHWPVGLLHDYLRANDIQAPSLNELNLGQSFFPLTPSASQIPQALPQIQPLKITLHLRDPPTEKLLISPSIESCKINFMNQLKEADFVRWGSVRRVTSLRKLDQDALWDGLVSRMLHC